MRLQSPKMQLLPARKWLNLEAHSVSTVTVMKKEEGKQELVCSLRIALNCLKIAS